jgi:hypothetical protein
MTIREHFDIDFSDEMTLSKTFSVNTAAVASLKLPILLDRRIAYSKDWEN